MFVAASNIRDVLLVIEDASLVFSCNNELETSKQNVKGSIEIMIKFLSCKGIAGIYFNCAMKEAASNINVQSNIEIILLNFSRISENAITRDTLIMAAKIGNDDIFNCLLAKKPDDNYKFSMVVKYVDKAFVEAVFWDHSNIVSRLLAKKTDGNYEFPRVLKYVNDAFQNVYRGHFKVVARLFANKENGEAEFPTLINKFSDLDINLQYCIVKEITGLEQVAQALSQILNQSSTNIISNYLNGDIQVVTEEEEANSLSKQEVIASFLKRFNSSKIEMDCFSPTLKSRVASLESRFASLLLNGTSSSSMSSPCLHIVSPTVIASKSVYNKRKKIPKLNNDSNTTQAEHGSVRFARISRLKKPNVKEIGCFVKRNINKSKKRSSSP